MGQSNIAEVPTFAELAEIEDCRSERCFAESEHR